MKRNESVYLQHIVDAIDRIEEYLEGIDEETFKQKLLISVYALPFPVRLSNVQHEPATCNSQPGPPDPQSEHG